MGEYTGRATGGIYKDIMWGVMAFIGAFITFLAINKSDLLQVLFFLFFCFVFAALMVHLFFFALVQKKLVVNDDGIFLYHGKKIAKKEYWKDIKKITSMSFGIPQYSGIGFIVHGKREIVVNDQDTIGHLEILKTAFKEIAVYAIEKGIKVEDCLRWARDIIKWNEKPEEYMGKWHRVKGRYKKWVYPTGIFTIIGITLSVIGSGASQTSYGNLLLYAGVIIGIFSFVMFLMAIYAIQLVPIAIYFDNHGIKIRFAGGEESNIPLSQVQDVRCFGCTGYVIICTNKQKCYSGNVDKGLCRAMEIFFSQHKS